MHGQSECQVVINCQGTNLLWLLVQKSDVELDCIAAFNGYILDGLSLSGYIVALLYKYIAIAMYVCS